MAARGLRADCAVDFSPGEVGISYIRPGLWNDSLIDAAPVIGSLIYSALSDCLIVFCTAGFSSKWTFCSTDFVLLAGLVLCVSSEGVVPLRVNVPDVIGLICRCEGAAESRVLQGLGHSQCASPGSGLSWSGPEFP